eukprot:Nk52_evm1s776 gene=Nk52_evmTU1s776
MTSMKYLNDFGIEFDGKEENILSVQFPLTRFGDQQQLFQIIEPLTMKEAVHLLENFLSQHITQTYYEKHHQDSFHFSDTSFEKYSTLLTQAGGENFDWLSTKWCMLGDMRYIEGVDVDQQGRITFQFGS